VLGELPSSGVSPVFVKECYLLEDPRFFRSPQADSNPHGHRARRECAQNGRKRQVDKTELQYRVNESSHGQRRQSAQVAFFHHKPAIGTKSPADQSHRRGVEPVINAGGETPNTRQARR
jgi:hypothetical protein